MAHGLCLGEIPCFRNSVFGRKSAGVDCVLSMKYYWELLNHLSEIWEVLGWRKYTNFNSNRKSQVVILVVTLNRTPSILHSPRPPLDGIIRNAKNMEFLLTMAGWPWNIYFQMNERRCKNSIGNDHTSIFFWNWI